MMNAQRVEINNCWTEEFSKQLNNCWTEEFSKQQTGCSERCA